MRGKRGGGGQFSDIVGIFEFPAKSRAFGTYTSLRACARVCGGGGGGGQPFPHSLPQGFAWAGEGESQGGPEGAEIGYPKNGLKKVRL